jgi:hypothetical protein
MSQKLHTLDYQSGFHRARDSRWTHFLWLLASAATLIVPLLALAFWVSRLKIAGR